MVSRFKELWEKEFTASSSPVIVLLVAQLFEYTEVLDMVNFTKRADIKQNVKY